MSISALILIITIDLCWRRLCMLFFAEQRSANILQFCTRKWTYAWKYCWFTEIHYKEAGVWLVLQEYQCKECWKTYCMDNTESSPITLDIAVLLCETECMFKYTRQYILCSLHTLKCLFYILWSFLTCLIVWDLYPMLLDILAKFHVGVPAPGLRYCEC